MSGKDSITQAWRYYENGRTYNNSLSPSQYATVNTNIEFFIGNQWRNLPKTRAMACLPKPVFNIIKRITSLFVASLTASGVAIVYDPLQYYDGTNLSDPSTDASEYATAEVRNLLDKFKMEYRIREALFDGAQTGDYCAHFYWDPDAVPYGGAFGPYRGEIQMELVDGINVMFGNPNTPNVEKQPYILIVGRDTVASLREEKRRYDKRNPQKKQGAEASIQGDTEYFEQAGVGGKHELIQSDDGHDKCLFLYMYTKKTHEEDVVDPKTGEVLHSKDVMMMPEDAEKFEQHGIDKIYIRTILGCRARVGVCAKCYGMNLATSKEVDLGEAVGIIAAQSIGEPGTQLTMRTFHSGGVAGDDITQGLPRVEELFEARRPKKMAQISEITGVVSVDETHRTALRNITVTADDGEVKVYQVPYSVGLKVAHGKVVEKGQPITDGALYPQDVLRISGVEAVQDYLVQSVQAVYRQQGVEINDKHIEVIIRQMMRKVRVEDPGDTALLTGSAIDNFEFEDANAEIQRRIDAGETELRPATASAMLLGITKAALATDSFLSAASFQETTKVLTDAAIKGKVDHLVGLKENVLIGKLIPAGSGLMAYRDYQPGATPEPRIPEEMIENALN